MNLLIPPIEQSIFNAEVKVRVQRVHRSNEKSGKTNLGFLFSGTTSDLEVYLAHLSYFLTILFLYMYVVKVLSLDTPTLSRA